MFQQGTTKLSVEKDKTSVVSDVGISFTDPRTQSTFFSTDFENHEFHLPKGVKVLSVKKASTERVRVSQENDVMLVLCQRTVTLKGAASLLDVCSAGALCVPSDHQQCGVRPEHQGRQQGYHPRERGGQHHGAHRGVQNGRRHRAQGCE